MKEMRGMTEVEMDLSCAKWRKSAYSSQSGNCVEVASAGRVVAVRDSKNPDAPPLAFTPEQWHAFTRKLAIGTSGPS
ncbi:MAG TPA: DUF397 domain-containing protein [Acidimicrobiales bacterium]|nr:DUF397 domain-containing protein [Acidimicrobiales bacterium]